MTNYGLPWSNGDLETLARMRAERRSYAECAEHLGRTEYGCRSILRRAGKATGVRWTPAEDDYVRLARAEGIPYKQIALELGRTPAAVWARMSHLNKEKMKEKMREFEKYVDRVKSSLTKRSPRRSAGGHDMPLQNRKD